MKSPRILLIIGGGIAAYKSLELIRELGRRGIASRVILTKAGAEFVTPLSVAALSGEKVYSELFDLTDETEMGHIELSRSADLVVVCPATADLMAKAAAGLANDLASTTLLATDKPVLMVPAMNVRMWEHAATKRNVARLRADGVRVVDPDVGPMACGEFGPAACRKSPPSCAKSKPRSRRRRNASPVSTPSSRPGRRASRWIRCAIFQTIPPASRVTASPPPSPRKVRGLRSSPARIAEAAGRRDLRLRRDGARDAEGLRGCSAGGCFRLCRGRR
jgi:3-polyprenyl-4-hydroxybenzoate decarboxylase